MFVKLSTPGGLKKRPRLIFSNFGSYDVSLRSLSRRLFFGRAVRRCAGNDGEIARLCSKHNGVRILRLLFVRVLLSLRLLALRQLTCHHNFLICAIILCVISFEHTSHRLEIWTISKFNLNSKCNFLIINLSLETMPLNVWNIIFISVLIIYMFLDMFIKYVCMFIKYTYLIYAMHENYTNCKNII